MPLHEWVYPLSERPATIDDSEGRRTYLTSEPQTELTTWLFDEEGKEVWYRRLDMNGKVLEETQPGLIPEGYVSIPFLFQGQYYDYETGLAYNRFRYYDLELGRYISEDPIRLTSGTMALHSYVEDSNSSIDVWGLSSTYARKFYKANPHMKKRTSPIDIHHRIPQMYIGPKRLFPESMRTSLSNLQALPREVHRKFVTPKWAEFRSKYPNPTRSQVIRQAMEVDRDIMQYL